MSLKYQQRMLLKQARIKNIPEGWKISTVESTCEVKNNLRKPISVNERALIQGKFPYYGPTGILDYINEYQLDGKYALIGEDGDHFLKYQSWSQTQLIQGKFNVNNHAHVIVEMKECLVEWFFVYYQHRNILNFVSRQGAGRYKLNKASLFSLPILLPPLDEQKKIAEILETCDRTLELTQKLITAKRKLKQALMQKLLTGKLRFPEFEEQKWKIVKLQDICKVRQGLQIPISERHQEFAKNRYIYITVSYINSKEKDNFNLEYIDNPRTSVICNDDDILVARTGAVGQIVTNIKGVFHNNFFCVDYFKNKITKNFLFFFLNSDYIQYQLKSRAATTTIPDLKHSDFYSLDIYLPSLKEQEKIASLLTNLDKEIEKFKKQKELLQNQKKGLMQKLLTGKIRVK